MSDITWGSPVDEEYDVVPFEIGDNGGGEAVLITIDYDLDNDTYFVDEINVSFSELSDMFNTNSIPYIWIYDLISGEFFNCNKCIYDEQQGIMCTAQSWSFASPDNTVIRVEAYEVILDTELQGTVEYTDALLNVS